MPIPIFFKVEDEIDDPESDGSVPLRAQLVITNELMGYPIRLLGYPIRLMRYPRAHMMGLCDGFM